MITVLCFFKSVVQVSRVKGKWVVGQGTYTSVTAKTISAVVASCPMLGSDQKSTKVSSEWYRGLSPSSWVQNEYHHRIECGSLLHYYVSHTTIEMGVVWEK